MYKGFIHCKKKKNVIELDFLIYVFDLKFAFADLRLVSFMVDNRKSSVLN